MLFPSEIDFSHITDSILNSPHLIYVMVDRHGIITFMNQTYLNLLEKSRNEVIGRHISEITPNTRLPEVLKTGEVHEADTWAIKGRDTIITRVPIIKDGKITGAIGRSIFLDMPSAKRLIHKLQKTTRELYYYKEDVRQIYRANWQFQELIGENTDFVILKSIAQQLSNTRSTILITGESGTGKELFAQAIHNHRDRQGPFVRISCPALPEGLLESELFGYDEGAFTGARKGGKPGKFELARGGTIFLDEIGDMPLTMQTKLLSVLQERVVERVGGTSPIKIHVRVIAATNRNLEQMVNDKEFREELYYRLNVVRLDLPPLRERADDIPLLVNHLIERINSEIKTCVNNTTSRAMHMLIKHQWPGNVRELENLLERAMNLAALKNERRLDLEHFPSLFPPSLAAEDSIINLAEGCTLNVSMERIEKEIIARALASAQQNKTQAARLLGLNKSAFYRKLRKYGIS